ncbi:MULTISPECIES: NifB/NifX family molybdenum-iron cluster-binding protein [Sporomusa]|uniref:NifB/NifX family molybdenum-iron cluster-binding protein n=1 Tax=Sporomusa TaxID=2375 RepID=UPI001667F2A3|nr:MULTISPECIES: NifB/NifX family molybdenum-iron cluster-binding protein [Sporomusa]HML33737.1 NifB/NifX family molybdenum-iron cluster-binding protein [Sporomusa sphaeroides]
MAKVAVASTDGVSINEHFGRAKEFWIYEVNEQGTYHLLERREVLPAIQTDHKHTAGYAAELLDDIEAVLIARIGPQAEVELLAKGVFALEITGPVDKALVSYGKRGKYIRSKLVRSPVEGS